MKELPVGFRAYERKWGRDDLPDVKGATSREVWGERDRFLEVLDFLYPKAIEAFREAIFQPSSRSRNVIPLDRKPGRSTRHSVRQGMSEAEVKRAVPGIELFLKKWRLNCPWMVEIGKLTLRIWSDQVRRGEELRLTWPNHDHGLEVDLRPPENVPAELYWDVLVVTKHEQEEIYRAHMRERQLAAWRAGLVPRGTLFSKKMKLQPSRRHEYLLMHLVGDMTIEEIMEWFHQRNVKAGKSGVERAIRELSEVVGLHLHPKQGRSKDGRRRPIRG